jgi:catechol 2,3-dioxygenase-like lactoylglutathione lyase family enzyme
MSNGEASTYIAEIGRVIVPVSDQERALEFYLGKLGFEKRADVTVDDGQRWLEVAPPGAVTAIALVPPRGGMWGVRRHRYSHQPHEHEIEADHADLRARGIDADPDILRIGGAPPMFFFRDQDGNTLGIVQSA